MHFIEVMPTDRSMSIYVNVDHIAEIEPDFDRNGDPISIIRMDTKRTLYVENTTTNILDQMLRQERRP